MEKKYELTEETIVERRLVLHRIKALKSFDNVRKGDLGGWIESENNLSQDGDCWVYGEAKVYGNSLVKNNAKVAHYSQVCDSIISDNANVFDHASILCNSVVSGNSRVSGHAEINRSIVESEACVFDDVSIINDTHISGSAKVVGSGIISMSIIRGNANVAISSNRMVGAYIQSNTDYFSITGLQGDEVANSYRYGLTFYRSFGDAIKVNYNTCTYLINEFRHYIIYSKLDSELTENYLFLADFAEKNIRSKNSDEDDMVERKKYDLTDEMITINEEDHILYLYRVIALKDFGDIKAGDLGGYIESVNNLSQNGNCWVYDNSKVYQNAIVKGDAKIRDAAMVFGTAHVDGNSTVCGESRVFGNATLRCGIVGKDANVCDDAIVNGIVTGNATVAGNACIYEGIAICGDAVIRKNSDYFAVSGISDNYEFSRSMVFCKSSKLGMIKVCLRSKCIDIEEFKNILKNINDHDDNFVHYEKYLRIVNMAETFLKNN